jgi:hypothetical protein
LTDRGGEKEVVSHEFKDYLSSLGLHQDRYLNQSGAHCQGGLAFIVLLRAYAHSCGQSKRDNVQADLITKPSL